MRNHRKLIIIAIANVNAPLQTTGDKGRRQIFEICLCLGYPCLVMALHYVVQGHRFNISGLL
jgi:pheromone a factor receptor